MERMKTESRYEPHKSGGGGGGGGVGWGGGLLVAESRGNTAVGRN